MNKNQEPIAAAVTSLDLHDIARASKTYALQAFHVITPLTDQQALVRNIIDHWVTGIGAQYNPDRRQALELIHLQPTLQDAIQAMTAQNGCAPKTVVTSARMDDCNLSFTQLRNLAQTDTPVLLIFGTAWGLAPEVVQAADYRLSPITGRGSYNHLSVRSAVSIILDRLFSNDRII